MGNSGAAGMHMRALGGDETLEAFRFGPRSGADMKKSWFLFGSRVLMLGSSITSTSGNPVETTVENRRIRDDGTNTVTVDGGSAWVKFTADTKNSLGGTHTAVFRVV